MNPEDFKQLSIACGVALIGGVTSYLAKHPRKQSIKEVFIKGLSSGFVGLLIGFLALHYQIPEYMAFFLSGTFGYMGSEVTISLFKSWLSKKLDNS